ncbi:hypothetical protein [Hymenobacter sp. B81]|uniref:hypothetical protein n=1 Tax=Hymenobacter sp. B81 TaxID=3344878 RepID=UPI0037DC5BE0
MPMPAARLLGYAALLLLTQCSKCKHDDPTPAAQLPAATQEGKNTFGCLVNGQVWLPQGSSGIAPNFRVSYDPGYAGGSLAIRTYRYPTGSSKGQGLILGSGGVARPGTYALAAPDAAAFFSNEAWPFPCTEYDNDLPGTYCRGTLTVTRLDIAARIVSGTFAFTLAKPGCDTLRVTDGRFDYRL